MIRKILLAAGATFLFASPSFAATVCRDAQGKFVKCPLPAKPVAATKAAPCRDAHGKFTSCAKAAPPKPAPVRCRLGGKFVKCGTPGAKPA